MERIALHTRLKAGREDEYERVHAVIPPDLRMAELLEVSDDYSGHDRGLRLVWELP
jgi:L-rhamnose mutarotase